MLRNCAWFVGLFFFLSLSFSFAIVVVVVLFIAVFVWLVLFVCFRFVFTLFSFRSFILSFGAPEHKLKIFGFTHKKLRLRCRPNFTVKRSHVRIAYTETVMNI